MIVQKLKKRYIMVQMIIFTVLLTTAFSSIYLTSLNAVKTRYERTLKFISRHYEENEQARTLNDGTSYAIFEVRKDQPLITVKNLIDTDEGVIQDVVNAAILSDTDLGRLPESKIAYLKSEKDWGCILYASDYTMAYKTVETLGFQLVVGWILLEVVIFFACRYLAEYVSVPVDVSLKQQKQFLSDASHELKTPLTVILANTSLLMEKHVEDAESSRWLSCLNEESLRMKKLVSNLLYLSSTDEQADRSTMEIANISDILEQAVLSYEAIAYENNIFLDTDIGENIRLFCVRDQIQQLAYILIDNAIKHAEVSEKVSVKLAERGESIIFSVTNESTLIDEEDLSHIFDRFYKADKNRTGSGYGLGLAIAKKIVESHNAKIEVSSNAETGTHFKVFFS